MPGRLPDPQLAAARQLARKSKWAPLVREASDGAVELIVAERGRLHTYHIDPGGTTMPLGRRRRPRPWRLGHAPMAAVFVEAGWSQLHSLGALSDDSAPLNFVSVAQLVTIEYLATQDGQHAVVRERAEGVAEVVTGGERGLELHLVTRDGSVSLLDKSGRHAPPGGTLAGKAIRAYGGRRENWAEVDLRPSD